MAIGVGPTSAMPRCASGPTDPSAIPMAITTSVAGMPGTRRNATSAASAASPSARLGQCHCATCVATPVTTCAMFDPATVTCTRWGSCLMMIVAASPKAKPRSTGRETNPARPPSRNSPSAVNITPTINVIAVASASWPILPISCGAAARLPSAAARIDADELVADTTANRLRPTSA